MIPRLNLGGRSGMGMSWKLDNSSSVGGFERSSDQMVIILVM